MIEQEEQKKLERKEQLQKLVEQINLAKQIRQNAAEYKEQLMEKAAYERRYGKVCMCYIKHIQSLYILDCKLA